MVPPGKIFLLTAVSLVCVFSGCVVNPLTGEEELMFFPEGRDIEIGRKYAPEVEKQLGERIANASIQNYVQSVGERVAMVSHRSDLEYHFVAVNDESVNAMALPGGYLFITKGMLVKLESEAQLAAILAHEVSHVVARDSMNVMSNQIGIGLLMSAAMPEDAPRGVTTATDIVHQFFDLRYSRTDERTADMAGLDYLYRAGYDPYGMVETMEMLGRESKTGSIEFFSTHPNPGNRVEYLTAKIKDDYLTLTGLDVGKEDYQRIVLGQLD